MKVSVIVPVYNVEKYIDKCLQSIKNQSLEDFECLIVNDGTKDNSIEIAKKTIGKDSRFRFLDKENGGLSDARNFGLNEATGEYICFIDSDDYIDRDLLKLSYEKAKEHNSDIVCFDLYYKDDDSLTISKGANFYDVSDYQSNSKLIFCNNSANNKLFKKDFIKEKKFVKGIWYEDLATIPLWMAQANNVSYVDKPLYYYVQRRESISHSADIRIFDIYIALSKIKEKLNLSSRDLSKLYLDNCLIMTTLRIRDIKDIETRKEYYSHNVNLLDYHYNTWFIDALKENYSFKQKIMFVLLKLRMINILDKAYHK